MKRVTIDRAEEMIADAVRESIGGFDTDFIYEKFLEWVHGEASLVRIGDEQFIEFPESGDED